jgi:DNA-binding MarR family transcriptional regulator
MIGEVPGIPAGLKDSLLFHLDAVSRIVNRRAEVLLQETLELGVRDPPLSQGYIADCLGVNRNVMVLEIDRMDDQKGSGYLKRERRPESRREATIVLTAKGRRALATIRKLRAQVWREVLRPTSTAQRLELIAWARAIIEKAQAPPKKSLQKS